MGGLAEPMMPTDKTDKEDTLCRLLNTLSDVSVVLIERLSLIEEAIKVIARDVDDPWRSLEPPRLFAFCLLEQT